jgi:type II secretory pathway pseudopilin PulG
MSRKLLRSQQGFTYLAALVIVILMGIMLSMVGETWSRIMQRDREEELMFRGKQIKNAIERYNKSGQMPPGGLKGLDILYNGDDRFVSRVRYLRKEYKDPITGKDFEVIRNTKTGIVGVFSPSDQEPLQKKNFPEELKTFEDKTKYSEWKFEYKAQPGQTGVVAPGAGRGTSAAFPQRAN